MNLLSFLLLFCFSAFAFAADDSSVEYNSGKSHYLAKCAFCHGVSGEGVGIFPALRGSDAKDVKDKLQRYRKSRKVGRYSAMMYVRASKLTDEQIEALSDYIPTLGNP